MSGRLSLAFLPGFENNIGEIRLPAPRPIPRPAAIPLPGPAMIPDLSSPVTGGGPSTLTLTIVSPRRITRPRVRFCWTVGAASFSAAPFVFFPYTQSVNLQTRA